MSTPAVSENTHLFNYADYERERLHVQHDLIQAYMGTLVLAPIDLGKNGLRILDSGTFDGHWLREALKEAKNPGEFIGTDISDSAFQQNLGERVSLKINSITDPWPEEWKSSFDLVHQRLVIACLEPDAGRDALYRLVDLAVPGTGWVQFTEAVMEHMTPEEKDKFPVLAKFQAMLGEMLPLLKWNPRSGLKVKEWLEAYGMEDVQEKVMMIEVGALNPDPRLGDMAKLNMLEVVAKFKGAAESLPKDCKIRPEDFDPILEDIKTEIDAVGGLMRYNTVWARRQV